MKNLPMLAAVHLLQYLQTTVEKVVDHAIGLLEALN
jgi:hypothetical protein